ncbi:MAG TPA: oligosaccharide flippase family protein [Sphingomicrobium sp.]|nr:oligosaccharide flippase family protein [Sphingomicrobium sp.]
MDRRLYLKQFMIILSGNGAAQAANLLSYPFLARLYTPHEFGVFATFVAAAAIPSSVACGRFELAVTTAPRWGRFGILWLCVAVAAGVGLLSVFGAAIYWQLSETAAHPSLPVLLGLSIFLTGVTSAQSMFLMRHDCYRATSSSLLVRTGGAVVVQLALAFVSATALSLILGFVFGLLAQAAMLALIIWRRVRPGKPKLRDMRAMFLRFRHQVTVDIPSTIIAAFSLNLVTFMLGGLYGQRVVGFYSIGQRLAITPLQLFNDALGQIFFQKAARARETKGHFWDEMKFSLLTSGLISLGVLVIILLVARPFIVFYLGAQWAPAADILVILAPMLAVRSLTMSIATTVFVMRAAHWLFIHNVANVAMTIAAYAFALFFGLGPAAFLSVAALLIGFEYAVFALFLIWASRRQHRRHGR